MVKKYWFEPAIPGVFDDDLNEAIRNGYLPAVEVFGENTTEEQRGHLYHSVTHEKWK
jgi:hypothetical protein